MSYMSTTNFALSSLLYPCHLAQAHRAMASTVKRSLPSLKRSLTISPIVSAISTMSSKCFVIFGLRLWKSHRLGHRQFKLSTGAISLGPRESLGLLEGLLAVCLVWTKTMAGDVFPVKEFARAAVREFNLVAAALRDGLVLDYPDAVHGKMPPKPEDHDASSSSSSVISGTTTITRGPILADLSTPPLIRRITCVTEEPSSSAVSCKVNNRSR